MTKIDIISGFLGAGKTTLIKKLLKEALVGEKVVLIENEFGEIGIDGGFLKDSGIQISEMNSGCICCSLVGDFEKSLAEVLDKFSPDRIIIEPSGVGKLSDIIAAVEKLGRADISLNSFTTVVDAKKCKTYLKNFGEFFANQVENARAIILSRTQDASEDKIAETLALLREHNTEANIVTAPWDELDGKQILSAMETAKQLKIELEALAAEHHHDDDDDNDDEHEHHHHCHCHDHDDHDDDDEHDHHHHHDHDDDDDDGDEHEHHHHHDHDDDDDDDEHEHHCHCHGHHHHHGHDADEVFTSLGFETVRSYTEDEVRAILTKLNDSATYGSILRSKGILPAAGKWIHFDFVPEESDVRTGAAETIGKICVIGADLNETALKELFRI
ncbi:MAG: GTP-binding protein [Clostridia bacterium]|nr:GTP-binding protein [Clostridia bacterium]